jgi:hypothetical protein
MAQRERERETWSLHPISVAQRMLCISEGEMSETEKPTETSEPVSGVAEESEPITFAEFLERTPPGAVRGQE